MTGVGALGRAVVAAVLAPVVACGDPGGGDPPDPVVRRDSAGIEIVENRAPVHPDSPWLVIPDAPIVSIGAWDGPEAEMFGMVRAVLLLGEGTVVVADHQALELRWFDSTGAHVRTSGGEGQGPGEFGSIGRLLRLSGDTVAAWDWAQRRMTLFTSGGDLVRTVDLELPTSAEERPISIVDIGVGSGPLGRLPDGSWIFLRQSIDGRPTGWTRSRAFIDRWDPDGSYLGPLISVPGEDFWGNRYGGLGTLTPWGRRASAAWDGRYLYTGNGDDYTIRVHEPDGRLVRLIRRPGAEPAITAEDRDRATRRRPPPDSAELAAIPESFRERARAQAGRAHEEAAAAMDATGFTTQPAFFDMIADGAGRLYVASRIGGVAVFDVVSGRFLGTAGVPRGSVLADRVAVVRPDSVLGFPKVLVYRIVEAR